MAATSPTYLSGYKGSLTIDASVLPVSGWQADHSVGTWDATNVTTAGASWPERTIESLKGSADVMWKVTTGAPVFVVGDIYPITLLTQTGQSYVFNGLITGISPKVEVKGGVTYNLKFESQGAITPAANA